MKKYILIYWKQNICRGCELARKNCKGNTHDLEIEKCIKLQAQSLYERKLEEKEYLEKCSKTYEKIAKEMLKK